MERPPRQPARCGLRVRRPAPRGLWRRLQDADGANLIEAALILPLILIVIFALMEFGGILYTRMALQNGVSQATRFAITRNVMPGQTREASIRTVLRRETPTLTIADEDITFSHMLPGAADWSAGTGPGNSIERVTVIYDWPIMTPFMDLFFSSDTVVIRAESAMKNESDPAL
jgi:Flp pilus assembly protein TadG